MTEHITGDPEILGIDLPELSMTALRWGDPAGRLVLCLHGFPDTAWSWRYIGPALATRGYHVVAPFTRGYAPTSIPADGDYSIGALMHDAIAVHEHLGGGADAVLIGHDWGSVTSNAMSGYRESPFGSIVSMSVPPISVIAGMARISLLPKQLRMSWYMAFVQIPVVAERSLDRLIPRLWRVWSPGYDAGEDLTHVIDAIGRPANRLAALRYYRSMASPRRPRTRYRNMHASLRRKPLVPILYLHGAHDGCIRVGLADGVESALPVGSRVEIIADAGHFLQVEQPAAVNDAIVRYLE